MPRCLFLPLFCLFLGQFRGLGCFSVLWRVALFSIVAVDPRTAVWVSTAEEIVLRESRNLLEGLGWSEHQLCIRTRPLDWSLRLPVLLEASRPKPLKSLREWRPPIRELPEIIIIGRNSKGQTKWDKRVSAVSCGVLRKSAVSCGFLQYAPPKCCHSQEKRKSAKISENLKETKTPKKRGTGDFSKLSRF